jgi:hypothetical protein
MIYFLEFATLYSVTLLFSVALCGPGDFGRSEPQRKGEPQRTNLYPPGLGFLVYAGT